MVYDYIQFINDFVKKSNFRVSFKEFYIEDELDKKSKSPLIRFLRPIFFKKKEKLQTAKSNSTFLQTMQNLKNSMQIQYQEKTRIFIGNDKKNFIQFPEFKATPLFSAKHFKTYAIERKTAEVPFTVSNKEPVPFIDYTFKPTQRDVYYCTKNILKKKKKKIFRKVKSLATEVKKKSNYYVIKSELAETMPTESRFSTPIKTFHFNSFGRGKFVLNSDKKSIRDFIPVAESDSVHAKTEEKKKKLPRLEKLARTTKVDKSFYSEVCTKFKKQY